MQDMYGIILHILFTFEITLYSIIFTNKWNYRKKIFEKLLNNDKKSSML